MGKKKTKESFILEAKKIHGDKYDYSKVEYINCDTKTCIICPEHGEFWQTPNCHIHKQGCPKCSIIRRAKKKTSNKDSFIEKAKKIHGDKYDYSKVTYTKAINKVCIICPIHGEFWQKPNCHISGCGCPECGKIKSHESSRKGNEQFILESKEKWGNKYDYSKVEYVNSHTKVCIICPKHGEFWQEPDNHLRWGCKKCRESKMEYEIREFLKENNIIHEEQKQFPWLKYKGFLKLDFYLPEYNIAIECQGEQHFEKFRWENDDKNLLTRQLRDDVKQKLCKEKGINIIYYTNINYEKYCKDKLIINNKEDLLKKILNYD